MEGKGNKADTKLTLTAYSDNTFSPKSMLKEYSVMINPESVKRQFKIKTDNKQTVGATGVEGNFQNMLPETISFNLVIDGTGALRTVGSFTEGENMEHDIVSKEVEKLLSVVYKIQKNKFDVNYVHILYGTISARCVLESLDISYVLFHRNGFPLRAKISLSFTSIENPKKAKKKVPNPKPPTEPKPQQPQELCTPKYECVEWRKTQQNNCSSNNSQI